MKRVVAVAALVALAAGSAQATCWTRDEASAANVRQLQSMLMVTALRCQAAGTGMMGDYNAFVRANMTAIQSGNDRIRAHFIHALGPIGGQRAYDSYTTSMANGYGAGGAGAPATCAAAAALAQEAGGMQGVSEGLLMLVSRLGIEARMPEGRCEPVAPMMVASAEAVTGPAFGQTRNGAYAPRYQQVAYNAAPAPTDYADADVPPAAVMPPPPSDDDPR